MNGTEAIDDLIRAALTAQAHAYAPYSRFAVGCALRTADGRIVAGCNVENAAYPQGQCAEASAIGALVSQGGARRIVEAVVAGASHEPCTPCGGCRQRLREFADDDLPVHMVNAEGVHLLTLRLGTLLPYSFGPDHLAR